MSAFFPSFEERLQLAFRGSAKEQKIATKKINRLRRSIFSSRLRAGGTAGVLFPAKTKLGGSNVFKKNLGGTAGG